MKQIQLTDKNKVDIKTNINIFLQNDSDVVKKMCLKNIINILYQLICSSKQIIQKYFPEQFLFDKQKQYRISKSISEDFFKWIQQHNLDSHAAMETLQYNIGQFIQAYWVFDNALNN